MYTNIEQQSAVPWWAAFGAPLIGVPLLVLLLAVGGPGEAATAPAIEPEGAVTSEQVEMQPVDWTAGVDLVAEADTHSRC